METLGPAEVAAHRAFLGVFLFLFRRTVAEHSTTVSFYAVESVVEKVGQMRKSELIA